MYNEANIPAEETPETIYIKQEVKTELSRAIKTLDECERLLLNLIYAEDLTLQECAKVLSLSYIKTRGIYNAALTKLKISLEEVS